MINNIINWLFDFEDKGSKETAKNRMKLMVVHDRQQLAPDLVEQMKAEILEVMTKYIDIDPENAECIIESKDNRVAYISTNVPLVSKERKDYASNKNKQKTKASTN